MAEQIRTDAEWPEGRTIVGVHGITLEELESEGWDGWNAEACIVLDLDDGTKLYPSRDPEGNGNGVMFGVDPNGEAVLIGPPVGI